MISPPEELTARARRVRQRGHLAENAARIRREATLAEQHRARVGRLVGGGGSADARRQGANRHSDAAAAASTAVITPRRTRLVRVPDLQAFRQAIVSCSTAARRSRFARRPSSCRRAAPAIICRVCRRWPAGAGHCHARRALPLFNARLAAPRDILTAASAKSSCTPRRGAAAAGARPPFQLRPGLVAEMLRFYDQLRRQGQSVDRYRRTARCERSTPTTIAAPSGCCGRRGFSLRRSAVRAAAGRAGACRRTRAARASDRARRRRARFAAWSSPSATGLPIPTACSPPISIC